MKDSQFFADPSNLHVDFKLKDADGRLKELLLYVSHACVDDPTFSKAKLLKILFFSDFESYGVHRTPITGRPYRKLSFGPCPVDFPRVLQEMIRDRQVKIFSRRVCDHSSERLFPL